MPQRNLNIERVMSKVKATIFFRNPKSYLTPIFAASQSLVFQVNTSVAKIVLGHYIGCIVPFTRICIRFFKIVQV